jgi:hypothetical protein
MIRIIKAYLQLSGHGFFAVLSLEHSICEIHAGPGPSPNGRLFIRQRSKILEEGKPQQFLNLTAGKHVRSAKLIGLETASIVFSLFGGGSRLLL